jgi:hypothetical protein
MNYPERMILYVVGGGFVAEMLNRENYGAAVVVAMFVVAGTIKRLRNE